MNILRVVRIPTKISNAKLIVHEFKVLDLRSNANILIGRDYMRLFQTITFDFLHLTRYRTMGQSPKKSC